MKQNTISYNFNLGECYDGDCLKPSIEMLNSIAPLISNNIDDLLPFANTGKDIILRGLFLSPVFDLREILIMGNDNTVNIYSITQAGMSILKTKIYTHSVVDFGMSSTNEFRLVEDADDLTRLSHIMDIIHGKATERAEEAVHNGAKVCASENKKRTPEQGALKWFNTIKYHISCEPMVFIHLPKPEVDLSFLGKTISSDDEL